MRVTFFAAALLISGLVASAASAAPIAPAQGIAHQASIIDVQYHPDRGRDHYRRPAPRPQRYRAGQRYRSAPHGWHRYDRRPGDWNRRGCVMVGPLWFCP
ncbi:MAG: hypothetical protein WC670_04885 [Pseudolabrys sp.]|jgi:hypothetical protein